MTRLNKETAKKPSAGKKSLPPVSQADVERAGWVLRLGLMEQGIPCGSLRNVLLFYQNPGA